MATFVGATVAVADSTATKLIDSSDVDREVKLYNPSNTSTLRLAYTSASASTGITFVGLAGSNLVGSLTLAADEELWAYQTTGNSINVELLTTSVGR